MAQGIFLVRGRGVRFLVKKETLLQQINRKGHPRTSRKGTERNIRNISEGDRKGHSEHPGKGTERDIRNIPEGYRKGHPEYPGRGQKGTSGTSRKGTERDIRNILAGDRKGHPEHPGSRQKETSRTSRKQTERDIQNIPEAKPVSAALLTAVLSRRGAWLLFTASWIVVANILVKGRSELAARGYFRFISPAPPIWGNDNVIL